LVIGIARRLGEQHPAVWPVPTQHLSCQSSAELRHCLLLNSAGKYLPIVFAKLHFP
jgi:hypothetical protein